MNEMTEPESQYYLAINGQTVGPYPLPYIAERLASGEFPPETLLWDGAEWRGWQEFASLLERHTTLLIVAAESGADTKPDNDLQTMGASEFAPARESVESGIPSLPALPVCMPQAQTEMLLPDWYRKDTEKVVVTKRGIRHYISTCRTILTGELAVKFIPWAVILPAFLAAATFGYVVKLYMVLTVGSGMAVGIMLFICVRVKWKFRLMLALLAFVTGLVAWLYRIGI